MKKILIFSLAYFPKHVGGAEVAIKEITDRISSEEYEFHMVTNRFDSTLPSVSKEGNVYVHRIGWTKKNPNMADLKKFPLNLNKGLFQFLAPLKAIQLHRKQNFDGIWAMMAHSTGVPATLFKLIFPKIPYVLTLQEGDPIEYIERKMRPLWPLFIRSFTSATIIQPISNFLAHWARTRGFQGVIEVVPNAVDGKRFSHVYSEEDLRVVQKRLDKKDGDVFLVTTSRLVKKNAVDDVIKALVFLPENIHFVVFGTGPDEKALRSLAQVEGVQHRVHFKGQIQHDEMPLFLKACDIFIRPSRSEGMGNSFVEAMAAGLPVVATQEGGIADFLFDEVRNPALPPTGWAVDKDNPKQIAQTITKIIANPEKVKTVLYNAQNMVLQKYDWDHVARSIKTKVFDPAMSG